MRTPLHRIGNSQGVILPKPLLAQVGLTEREVEMTVERGAIVLRKPRNIRANWLQAAEKIAKNHDDTLVWPEFGNEADASLEW